MKRELYKYEWVDEVLEGGKVIDTGWVVKEKENKLADDPKKFKARLTAEGFTQRPGIDFHETYVPVCREESADSYMPRHSMVVAQFDIKGVFLNAPCKKRSTSKDKHATGNRVWRLRKSLYGTKQAAHNSNRFIDDLLKGLGFQQCKDDAGLYFRIADGSIMGFTSTTFSVRSTQDRP